MSLNVIAGCARERCADDPHCPHCGGGFRAPCDCAFGGAQLAVWSEGFPLKLRQTTCTDYYCSAGQ